MKIQNVKGGYDFLPNEQKIRNYINNTIIKNFELYGFKSIETPILCYYDMLSDKYDENNDILKEIYRLKDQGNRDLGLRYDLTVPFAKFITLNKNKITFPFKRYEIAKVFRDGPVKVGRDREFIQCDADVVGIEGQLIEAELLTLYIKTFQELGINIYIKYNNRKLMTGLILESGIKENLIQEVTTILDKKDKISKEELTGMLENLNINKRNITKLDKLFNMALKELNNKYNKSKNILIKEGLEEVYTLYSYLSNLNICNICIFDITLVRGQNYYTGNVFEVYDKERRVKGSIGGGGRYDKMITEFISDGKEYPTVGISFGLSSIYEITKDKFNESNSSTDIYIIPMSTESKCLNIANKLRDNGYKVEIEMNNRKLKKSLDYVNKQKIRYAIIIGSKEIETGKITIKDMLNSQNIEISISSINKLNLPR